MFPSPHLANENFNEETRKLIWKNCCCSNIQIHSLSPASFFKVTRASHPSPASSSSISSPPTRTLFHPPTFWHRATFPLEQHTPGHSRLHKLHKPPFLPSPPRRLSISVTNQQRHSRVIGFYVMLSSRQLRIRFPSGWARDIPIKASRSRIN